MFGTNVLSNAVHGPSDVDSAKEAVRIIFGEVEFDSEGRNNLLFSIFKDI